MQLELALVQYRGETGKADRSTAVLRLFLFVDIFWKQTITIIFGVWRKWNWESGPYWLN